MTLSGNAIGQLIPLFYTQATIVVTLDEPDPGDTITNAEFDVEWSFSGTQVSFVVQIFADADADDLVYSSGVVVSPTKSHSIPVGTLDNLTTYWVVVSVIADDGTSGETDLVEFSTSFAPSVAVEGVTARAYDSCSTASDAPEIEIRWNQIVPGPGETFVEYRVLRKLPGDTTWTTLAEIDAIGTIRYRDRFPRSHTGYVYAVIWVASAGSDTLISGPDDSKTSAVARFDYGWIQPVSNPDSMVRIESFDSEVQTIQDTLVQATAGRRAPTAFVGESLYHIARIPSSPKLPSDSQWATLEEFLNNQAEGEIYCLRLGKQRQKFFGILTAPNRTNGVLTYGVGFSFTETHYTEGV